MWHQKRCLSFITILIGSCVACAPVPKPETLRLEKTTFSMPGTIVFTAENLKNGQIKQSHFNAESAKEKEQLKKIILQSDPAVVNVNVECLMTGTTSSPKQKEVFAVCVFKIEIWKNIDTSP